MPDDYLHYFQVFVSILFKEEFKEVIGVLFSVLKLLGLAQIQEHGTMDMV